MTISVLAARNELTANAGQTIFNYTFKIFSITDLNVYITPAGQDANDSTDLTTAFTVLGVGDEDGGTITLTTGANLNDLITIVSNIPSLRTTDYQNNGDFRPDVVNDDFDRVVSLVKKIEDTANRGLALPQSQQGPKPLSLPRPEANKLLTWKGDLSGLQNNSLSELGSDLVTTSSLILNLTLAEAKALDTAVTGQIVQITDRANAQFKYITATTNNEQDFVEATGSGLTLSLIVDGEVSAKAFGVVATPAFDNAAIFTNAGLNHDLFLPRTSLSTPYESGKIVPSFNFILDGHNASMKNLSLTQPLFFDNAVIQNNELFYLKNIKLDLNKDIVTFGNLAGGGVWLGQGNDPGSSLEWDTCIIDNVDVENGFRNVLNILSTDTVIVKNYSSRNAGIQGSGFFSYGGVTENCRSVILEDIIVKNSFGFGWHLFRCDRVDARNLMFLNLTKDGKGIGLTLTESKQVHVRGLFTTTDGDCLEINASQDVIIENFNLVSSTDRGILIGDNGTGIDCERVILRNGTAKGVTVAMAINFCHTFLAENVFFDGEIDVITSDGGRSSDLRFSNCQIATNIENGSVGDRFIHDKTRFLDCVYSQHDGNFEMTGQVNLAQDEHIVVPIGPILQVAAEFFIETIGESASNVAQMGYKRYRCTFKGNTTAGLAGITLVQELSDDGDVTGRHLTVELVSDELRIVNRETVDVIGNWKITGLKKSQFRDQRPNP